MPSGLITLLLAMIPLYAGPLLAGWIGATVLTLGALAAIFFLAQLAGGKVRARAAMPLPAFLIMLAGAQLLAVSVVFALGIGLRMATGPLGLQLWVAIVSSCVGGTLFAWRLQRQPISALAVPDITQSEGS